MTTNVATVASKTLKLRDGRTLAYAEAGDPAGAPVLFSPGLVSSRLMRHPDERIPAQVGLRLLTLDRPGVGLSTYRRGRTLLTWADDVAQLADALGIEQFGMVGYSGGGPYALACASKHPTRVRRVALLASIGPMADPAMRRVLREAGNGDKLKEVGLAQRIPHWLLTLLATPQARAVRKDPEKAMATLPPGTPEADRAALANPAFRQILLQDAVEAYRQGATGMATDFQLLARPWGFNVTSIQVPVHVWQGEADRNVPPAVGRYLAATLPHCTATFLPDDGHVSIFLNHWGEVLADLKG